MESQEKKEELITILTPTYNRSSTLPQLYVSLKEQTKKNFIWVIIDDGSTDDTSLIVETFDESKVKIEYYKKKNGGKHTAINFALEFIKTELVMVVDSDDTLVDNAIEMIYKEYGKIKDDNIAAMIFLKQDTDGKISGGNFEKSYFSGNLIEEQKKFKQNKEIASIWKTEIIKKYPFPEFKNEKFIAEGSVTLRVSEEYNVVFINKVIYLFEYLDDGLTTAGRKLRIKNPLGGIYLAKVVLASSRTSLSLKYKWMLFYICYSFFAKIKVKKSFSESQQKSMYIICFPFGYILYKYWENKYLSMD